MYKEKSGHCPHCGRALDSKTKHLTDNQRATGWTEAIVEQAARETGLNVFAGPTTMGNSQERFVGIWCNDERGLDPFWERARELIEEAQRE